MYRDLNGYGESKGEGGWVGWRDRVSAISVCVRYSMFGTCLFKSDPIIAGVLAPWQPGNNSTHMLLIIKFQDFANTCTEQWIIYNSQGHNIYM